MLRTHGGKAFFFLEKVLFLATSGRCKSCALVLSHCQNNIFLRATEG